MPASAKCSKRKAASQLSVEAEARRPDLTCTVCGQELGRRYDLKRHMKQHPCSGAEKLPCPYKDLVGCNFSTLQKSNLDTHARRHTQDRSIICKDDPNCEFNTCDPAALHRHRILSHNYKPSTRRKPSRVPTHPEHKASMGSPSSGGSPFSVEPSLEPFSPASSTVNLPFTNHLFSPSQFSPFGFEKSRTSPFFVRPVDSSGSISTLQSGWQDSELTNLHRTDRSSLPRPYNYSWDPAFSGFDLLAAEPNIEERLESQSEIPSQRNYWPEPFNTNQLDSWHLAGVGGTSGSIPLSVPFKGHPAVDPQWFSTA